LGRALERALVHHTDLVLLLGGTIGALLALSAWAYRLEVTKRALVPLRSIYGLRNVHRLSPSRDVQLAKFVPQVYLFRRDRMGSMQPDDLVRMVLRRVGDGTSHQLGACIIGRPTQGKTRMAWEAMQAELPDWLFVRWPKSDANATPLDLGYLRGKR